MRAVLKFLSRREPRRKRLVEHKGFGDRLVVVRMDAGVEGRCVFARHRTVIGPAAHHLAWVEQNRDSRSRNSFVDTGFGKNAQLCVNNAWCSYICRQARQ